MRRVIYAQDMEPLTVVELSDSAEFFFLERYRRLVLPVSIYRTHEVEEGSSIRFESDVKIVRLCTETFYKKNQAHLILFTEDEESALLLKCVFLPGQYGQLHEQERIAFAKGFIEAWQRLG